MDERLVEVFRRVFRVEMIGEESSPETIPAWDSLAHLALVSELEREFEIDLSPDEVIEMVNIRAILEILAERGAVATDGTGTERASTVEREGR
jgi:acyl carrier protein